MLQGQKIIQNTTHIMHNTKSYKNNFVRFCFILAEQIRLQIESHKILQNHTLVLHLKAYEIQSLTTWKKNMAIKSLKILQLNISKLQNLTKSYTV